MKKSKTMRLASGLLVLTLLSTCMVAGTFAKYTTSDSASDQASVAKWGVKITSAGTTFAKQYATTDQTASTAGITYSVKSADSNKNVVAPGTDGTMAAMSLTGKPEVAVRVTYAGDFKLEGDWTVANSEFYCPLVIKVNNQLVDTSQCSDATSFNNAVNNAINAYSKDYAANTDLSTIQNDSLNVTWEWPYEAGANDEAKAATDVKDTALGDKATAPTVTLAVTTTVTQID